jgi:FMN hydrolase / 5-amino-6-(5-phospho-D-ribitylamino)uracil phosphatase
MNDRTIRLLTFDLDDTLWHFAPVLLRAEEITYRWLQQRVPELCAQYSIATLQSLRLDIARNEPHLAHRISELRLRSLQHALERAGIDSPRATQIAHEAFEIFLHARHDVELFEQAEHTLAHLQTNYQLAAITNGNFDIRRIGLDRYFSFAINAEHLPRAKPHPEPFLEALQRAGCTASQSIHIGDDIDADMRGAQRVGMHTVWVNATGESWPDNSPPTKQIRHLHELPDAVSAIVTELERSRN